MKGDYSKISFNDAKKMQHYRKVYLQQGRVLLDSDLNENTDLLHYQTKTLAKDVACLCGSPNSGFRIGKCLPLLPVGSTKGWSIMPGNEQTAEPAISYESENVFEDKGSLLVKGATDVFFTLQKPLDLSRCAWIRIGMKERENPVPSNMSVKLFLENNTNTLDKYESYKENSLLFFQFSLKNSILSDFKGIANITKIGLSGFNTDKIYLISTVECSPPMFTLDSIVSMQSFNTKGTKAEGSSDIYQERECIKLKGVNEFSKQIHVPVDFNKYEKIMLDVSSSGQDVIQFFAKDEKNNKSSWNIKPGVAWGAYLIEIAKPDVAKANLNSIVSYGFENLKDQKTYYFGPLLYQMQTKNNFVIAGNVLHTGETGRLYVNGELYEKELAETYLNQKDYPSAPPMIPPSEGTTRNDLVYAQVWQRHVTPVEDPQLRETALGGPDTCNRMKAMVQVKVLKGVNSLPEELKMPTGGGRLSTVTASSLTVKSCERSPEDEYTGWDNRLYRVEIHSGVSANAGAGTFKWSRNNASTVSPVVQNVKKDALSLVIKDFRLFKTGDIIEIIDDTAELSGIPGELRLINEINPDENRLYWSDTLQTDLQEFAGKLSRPYAAEGMETTHPRVIKWDGVRSISAGSTELEDGVKIRLSGSGMRPGDYWTFTARANTHEVERLEYEPAHGIMRHCCPLAVIHWNGSAIEIIEDIRGRFKPLGELGAADIAFDCRNSAVQAENVQQAIENLQLQLEYGKNLDLTASSLTLKCSNVHESRWPKLMSTMRENKSNHGDICFLTGSSETERMRILEEGHIGIGTMNPENSEKWEKVLDIYSCLNAKMSLRTKNIDARIQVQEKNDKEPLAKIWGGAPDGMIVGTKSKSKLSFATDGNTRLIIDEYGNVGIGTTKLTDKLNVEDGYIKTRIFPSDDTKEGLTGFSLESREKGGGTHTWRMYTAPCGGGYGVPANSLTFWEYDNIGCNPKGICHPRLVLQANTGNVGIGTTDISEKLVVNGNIKISGKINQDPWIEPELKNGWSRHSAKEYSPPGYFLDKNGIVHLRGLVSGGNGVIFVLKEGYRPEYSEQFFSFSNRELGICIIDRGGQVYPHQYGKSSFSLDGIAFRAREEELRNIIH